MSGRRYKRYLASGEIEDLSDEPRQKLIKTIKERNDSSNGIFSESAVMEVVLEEPSNIQKINTVLSNNAETGEESDETNVNVECEGNDEYDMNNDNEDIRPLSSEDEECQSPYFVHEDVLSSDGIRSDSDDDRSESDVSDNDHSDPNHSNDESAGQLFGIKNFYNIISPPVEKSVGELFVEIIRYSLRHKLTFSATCDLLHLVNGIFSHAILPETKYMIDKILNPKNKSKFHIMCPKCNVYIGDPAEMTCISCSICKTEIDLSKTKDVDFFMTMDPSDSIADALNKNSSYYNYVVKERKHEPGCIKDIYDGNAYRKFVQNLPSNDRQNYATAVFNTDGAQRFKNSKNSVWPIYLMINELPVEERFKNLLTCGLWFGRQKPDMNSFLTPFVHMMNTLASSGINCTIQGEMRTIKLYALLSSVDSVARAPMQGIRQFNGFYGCSWCLHPGEWYKGSMRYPILTNIPEDRTMEKTVQCVKEVVERGMPVYGVKQPSRLLLLNNFDIIGGFVPDYMHACLRGVGKQVTEVILKSMTKEQLNIIDSVLKNIKAPHQITRLCRQLKDRADWKAKEWENWILYYSIPVFRLVVPQRILKHWCLFVDSLYILLSTAITHDDLKTVNEMLGKFAFDVQEEYGKESMTYNVHQLLHIANSVLNWAPLWAQSTFPFESENGVLLKAMKSAKGVAHQIIRYINMNESVKCIENYIYSESLGVTKLYWKKVTNKQVFKSVKVGNVRYFGKGDILNQAIRSNFDYLSDNCKQYDRLVKKNCLFTSCMKLNSRSDNSFARLVDGRYIKIYKFAVDDENLTDFCICSILDVENWSDSSALNIVKNVDDHMTAVPAPAISTICIYIKASNN